MGCIPTTTTKPEAQTQTMVVKKPTELPSIMPDDFNIIYGSSPGMVPEATTIQISEKESFYQRQSNNVIIKIPYEVTKEELQSLYKVFYTNGFDQIETYEEGTYDRGGVSIQIRIGNRNYFKVNGGMSYVKPEYLADYQKIVDTIVNLNSEKTKGKTPEYAM